MKVWLKRRFTVAAKQDQVYHTEKCQHWHKAPDKEAFKKIDIENVPDDARECKQCSGEALKNKRSNQDQELNTFLQREDVTPEDIGL